MRQVLAQHFIVETAAVVVHIQQAILVGTASIRGLAPSGLRTFFCGVIIVLTIVILIVMVIDIISMMMIITIILSLAESQPKNITRGPISLRSETTEATPLYGHGESSCDCMGATTSKQAACNKRQRRKPKRNDVISRVHAARC